MTKIDLNGTKIEIRGLTRTEIMTLRDQDQIPIGNFALDPEKLAADLDLADQAMDLVLETVLDPEDTRRLGHMPAHCALKVFRGILSETYVDPEAEKN